MISATIHASGCFTVMVGVSSSLIRAASTAGSLVESMIRIEQNAARCAIRFSCTRLQRRRIVCRGTGCPSLRSARRRTRRTLILGSAVPKKIASTAYPRVAASRNTPRRHSRANVVSMPKLAPAARHLVRAAAASGQRPSRSVFASRLKKCSGSSCRWVRVRCYLPAPLAPINSTSLGCVTLIFPSWKVLSSRGSLLAPYVTCHSSVTCKEWWTLSQKVANPGSRSARGRRPLPPRDSALPVSRASCRPAASARVVGRGHCAASWCSASYGRQGDPLVLAPLSASRRPSQWSAPGTGTRVRFLPGALRDADARPSADLHRSSSGDPDSSWRLVRGALEDPRWRFRSVEGIADATGLEHAVVARPLELHRRDVRGIFARSRSFDGVRRVYTLASRPRTFLEIAGDVLAFASR